LEKGEEEGVHKKYLTSNRNPWYSLENRATAPIWVSVFNRTGLRFIRNEAGTANLTTFHCVYPINSSNSSTINIDLLFAYLLTDVAKLIFEDNSREYGNGLQKFEPNDICKGSMLDLRLVDSEKENEILVLYSAYRGSVLNGLPNPKYIESINNLFVKGFTK
jgi:adenine-specific DNA-methyltransferase